MYGLTHDALEVYWNLTIIAPNETSKVPKLQNTPSATSTGTSSLSHEVSSDMSTRGLSLDSIPGPWFSSEHVMQTAMQTAVVPSTLTQASAGGPSTTLTGYCDTVIRANPQTLARRNHARPTDIPILEYSGQNERNASQPRILNGPDTSVGFVQTFHNQRSGYFSSPQTAHSYQPASLQQHNTPTMDDDCTSLDPISALLRAGEISSSQGRLGYPQHQRSRCICGPCKDMKSLSD